MSQISRDEFRRVFFQSVYFNEVSRATKALEPQLIRCYNESVKAAGAEPTLLYKRYSKEITTKIVITKTPSHSISVRTELSPEVICQFNLLTPPSIENLKNKMLKKLVVNKVNFNLVPDQDAALQNIINLSMKAYNLMVVERAKLNAELMETMQKKFNRASKLKFSDISDLYFNYSAQAFNDYLVKNKFTGVPGLDKFPVGSHKNFTSYPSAYPMIGWELSRMQDGYGHECGSSIEIDWVNKKLSIVGWSSDD